MTSGMKRGLLTSPLSAEEKDSKKAKTGGSHGDDAGEEDAVFERNGSDSENVARKERKGKGRGESTLDVSVIHEIVLARVEETLGGFGKDSGKSKPDSPLLRQLIPALATAVSVAMGEVMKGVMADLDKRYYRESPAASDKMLTTVTRLTYENDRLQQYTRRESVRVWGVKQEEKETAEEVERKALDVFSKAGADVKVEDIAAVHRVGKPKNGSRPILVKFVSRRKRREVMGKKKELKGKQGFERVFINDDLTPLRARLLGHIQRLDIVEKAWTVDGRIHCQKKLPPGHPAAGSQKPIVVETPDDLFKLGVDVDYAALGLTHLAPDC